MYKKIHQGIIFMLTLGLLTSPEGHQALAQGEEKDSSMMTFKKIPLKLPAVRNLYSIDKSTDSIADATSKGLFKNFLNGLTTGGYYRGYFYGRTMGQMYGNVGAKKVMNVGDGNYDPMLFLYVGGQATPNTSFGSEIILANPFEVYRGPGYTTNGSVNNYFNMVLRGNFKTKLGTFTAIAGGIEWLRLTPFTFGANVGFNRFSIFERRPWDPVGNIKTRYAAYYYSGNINQDTRWGTQAFKGFMMSGLINKINTNVDIFYGKTAPNGGIDREHVVRPSENLGIRFKKNFKNGNYLSLNTFNSFNRSDSINRKTSDVQWNIYTSEFSFNHKGIVLNGEIGAGRYKSPTYKESWGEGIIMDLSFPKKTTFVPLAIRYYQIGRSFTSNVANFNNTSVREVTLGYNGAGQALNTPFGGSLDGVGDLANNRRGVALNTNSIRVWKFSFSVGSQISEELEKQPFDTVLNYSHRVNNLVWSRLPGIFPFYERFGPNNRSGIFYRGAYEVVNITERNDDGTAKYKRYFNSTDVQAKFKSKVVNRDLYLFYLGTFSSAQNALSAVTVFDNSAYIRAQYHELDVYYQVTDEFYLTLYGGLERIRGNQYTDLGPTGLPRDQTGTAIGVGFDFSISSQTTLFFRQRWFAFEDKNFPGEKFNGSEATVELKIYF